jgi:hypothetical protein
VKRKDGKALTGGNFRVSFVKSRCRATFECLLHGSCSIAAGAKERKELKRAAILFGAPMAEEARDLLQMLPSLPASSHFVQ